MSRFNEETVSCPFCGQKSSQQIATSLAISDTTTFRENILSGEFQVFSCDNCDGQYQVDTPFMYLDFGRKLMIAQFPQTWVSKWQVYESEVSHNFENYIKGKYAAPSARKMSEGFRIRTVFGLDSLAEKISCMEVGIDDRLLTILKLQLIDSLEEIPFHPAFVPIFKGVNSGELFFSCPIPGTDGTITNELISLPFPDAIREVQNNLDVYQPMLETFRDATYIDLGRVLFSKSK